jgi:serine/threonine protein kinase
LIGPEPPSIPGFDHVRLLGSGRFADVHLYQQQFPRRLVAVKVIKEHLLTWESEHAFELEANALASLSSHPCIVAIHDAGRSDDGHAYLVMEYCPLPTLAEQVKTERFTTAQALRIGILLAGAVDTAHAHGIVHRDIKPSNVLMTDYGAPKLADFGIASSAWDRNAVTGFTPAWAPPELITGEGIATAAVYSVAATVYTLLAGHAPHIRPGGSGNSVEDIVARATARPAPSLPAEIEPEVASVLGLALSREPEQRYQTARELGEALQRAQEELGLTTTAMSLVAPPRGPVPQAEESASTWPRDTSKHLVSGPGPRAKGRHRPWLAWLAAVVVLGAVAAVIANTARRDDNPSKPSNPKSTTTAGRLSTLRSPTRTNPATTSGSSPSPLPETTRPPCRSWSWRLRGSGPRST